MIEMQKDVVGFFGFFSLPDHCTNWCYRIWSLILDLYWLRLVLRLLAFVLGFGSVLDNGLAKLQWFWFVKIHLFCLFFVHAKRLTKSNSLYFKTQANDLCIGKITQPVEVLTFAQSHFHLGWMTWLCLDQTWLNLDNGGFNYSPSINRSRICSSCGLQVSATFHLMVSNGQWLHDKENLLTGTVNIIPLSMTLADGWGHPSASIHSVGISSYKTFVSQVEYLGSYFSNIQILTEQSKF